MKLRVAQQKLEEYFAKKYTRKYTELGGYFSIKGYKELSKSPMQKYFSSGKYKELKDPILEDYWKEVKKSEFEWNIFVVVVIILFYVLNR